ncbi:MAG: nucleotide-binding protein [Candidatus Hydrogenedentes bacterium]|nr:nucleotide-binding protein [Candidatus Hydrogenedentota bacterium]
MINLQGIHSDSNWNKTSGLRAAGHEVDTSSFESCQSKALPAPSRKSLLKARDVVSEWSHTKIDDLLLEAGVSGLNVEQGFGSRRKRANAIIQFAIDNPSALTAEHSLFSAYLAKQALKTSDHTESESPQTQAISSTPIDISEFAPAVRSPNRVFVVHGQNDTARNAVVYFLESIGLEGIVLHEQPSMGRHLLTKFIEEAELVTFAVILMTDDDVGSLKEGVLRPRARQNVILELGYFLARLGQSKVCALITPGLETPSDFDGIVYIRMDNESRWELELRRELVAAGMPVVELPKSE